MHINARDLPPSKAFCFIIEYPPWVTPVGTHQSRGKSDQGGFGSLIEEIE